MSTGDAAIPAEKVCTRCQRSLPLTAFYHQKDTRDGLNTRCKTCRNAAHAAYVAANKEQHREARRRYDAAHREEQRAASRRYVARHPEKIQEARRQYAAKRRRAGQGIEPIEPGDRNEIATSTVGRTASPTGWT